MTKMNMRILMMMERVAEVIRKELEEIIKKD
jgi:hypothetical protein